MTSALPQQRTCDDCFGMSVSCRYCCKSRKSNNPKNLAKVDLRIFLPLRRSSAPLGSSVIDFGGNDRVPEVAARKTHQLLYKFSFVTPKRLLQQYLLTTGIQTGWGGWILHSRTRGASLTWSCQPTH